MLFIADALHEIADLLTHVDRKLIAIIFFQHVGDAALARLRIDADDVGLIHSADVARVDRQVWHGPLFLVMFFAIVHAFGNGILMGAAEGREYELSGIRLTIADLHARHLFIDIDDARHIAEIELRIHAHGIHVHRQGDDVHVAGALAVAEERALDAVSAGQQTHLAVGHAAAAVIVRMQGDDDVFAVVHVLAHIFDLAGIDVRHGHLHRHRQVDDHLVVCAWLPDIEHGVAHFQGIIDFRAGKALWRVFEPVSSAVALAQFLQQLRAFHSDLLDLFL